MYLNDNEFNEVVRRHQDQSAPGLAFVPDLARMLNYDYCNNLSKDLHFDGKWEWKKAVANLTDTLPLSRGLYMFVWKPPLEFKFADGAPSHSLTWVLYVGKAGVENGVHDTFKDRYRSDYKAKVGTDPKTIWNSVGECNSRDTRLARYLAVRPLEYWFLPINDLQYLKTLEQRLIKLLNPPLNTQHCKIHTVKTRPAF